MVLFFGDFYGRTPARRPLSREFNLSSRSHCSSYELNESLTQRDDLQVQLSHDDLESPFDSFTSNGPGATSTPMTDRQH